MKEETLRKQDKGQRGGLKDPEELRLSQSQGWGLQGCERKRGICGRGGGEPLGGKTPLPSLHLVKGPPNPAKLESFWNVALEKVYLGSPPPREGAQAVSDSPQTWARDAAGQGWEVGSGVGEGRLGIPSCLGSSSGKQVWTSPALGNRKACSAHPLQAPGLLAWPRA